MAATERSVFSRRGLQVRGRAGPVFASIFLPTLKNAEPRGRSGRLSQLENREFSLGSLVGDIGKQWTLEWQQGVLLITSPAVDIGEVLGTSALFRGWRMDYSSSPSRRRHRQATDDGTAAALLSRPQKSPTMPRQHQRALNTLANIRRWRKGQFIISFRLERWNTPCRFPWQPARSLVSMATLCFELGDSIPQSTSLSFAVGFGAW